MEDQVAATAPEMRALIFCEDTQFLRTAQRVLTDLGVTTEVNADYGSVVALLSSQKIDAVVVDWSQIHNLGEFFEAMRRSRRNQDCIVVAIVRDLLDLRQAFAAGVHFMLHKPASVVQIARCCRAVHSAMFARRRKNHREQTQISASFSSKNIGLAMGTILNLSEGGAGLKINGEARLIMARLAAGDEVEVNFTLPETSHSIHACAVVAWRDREDNFGVQFRFIPDQERTRLEQWLGGRLERSLRELRERYAVACA
ncbi:MAG: PilZ domain-containing protein [Acidobacteriia bacterium]|nr:PilZ domain-containing protein [Terriglobia bacterium]